MSGFMLYTSSNIKNSENTNIVLDVGSNVKYNFSSFVWVWRGKSEQISSK